MSFDGSKPDGSIRSLFAVKKAILGHHPATIRSPFSQQLFPDELDELEAYFAGVRLRDNGVANHPLADLKHPFRQCCPSP